MKRFLLKISLFLLLLCTIAAALLFLVPANRHHYVYAHRLKMEALDSLAAASPATPRIIFVGGSNLAFGLDCQKIEEATGRPVVNAGTHAAIGLRFVADEVISRLRPGDTVVFMPEYGQFFDLYCGSNESLADAVMYSGPKSLRLLSPAQWLTFMAGVPRHIKGNLAQIPLTGYTYRADGFNRWGDETAHWQVKREPLRDLTIPITSPPDMAAFDDFARKVAQIRSRGARAVLLWPLTTESNCRACSREIEIIEKEMGKRGLHFAAEARQLAFPDSLAFDTPFHSSKAAVDLNTQKIIKILEPSETEI